MVPLQGRDRVAAVGAQADNRVMAVRRLIELAPDSAIVSLEAALAGGGRDDRSIAMIHTMVSAEMSERRIRSAVFAPVMALCEPNGHLVGRLNFPGSAPTLAWRALKAVDPDLVELAVRKAGQRQAEEAAPEVFEDLCRRVALELRAGNDAFAPLRRALDAMGPDVAVRFGDAMALAPLVRRALPKLPTWVRTLSAEYAAAIRLAFRDATAVDEAAGPTFMEMLYAQLDEPWQVLRLISLVMDRPGDRYLAGSELADFGERLLADVEAKLAALRKFDPDRGLEAGVEAAACAHAVIVTIGEFDQWLAMSRDGPWGRRLLNVRRSLASLCEARLAEADPALTAALPTVPTQFAARVVRGAPNVSKAPDEAAFRRAQALFAFLYETRVAAGNGGFGVTRGKIVEALDGRVDQYVEDLLEMLHEGRGDPARIRAYLDMAATLLGMVREPQAAEIVRRRAAVA